VHYVSLMIMTINTVLFLSVMCLSSGLLVMFVSYVGRSLEIILCEVYIGLWLIGTFSHKK
jgi:hypothetical protein